MMWSCEQKQENSANKYDQTYDHAEIFFSWDYSISSIVANYLLIPK